MKLTYREQTIEIITNLIKARNIIFEQIINLAMSNELDHLEGAFDDGDIYSFSLTHFENVEDVNVQKLVQLCRNAENTVFTIMDFNTINKDEVNLFDE